MSELLDAFSKALGAGSILALPIALLGGFVAALNPCCLAMYPAAAATCCGVRESDITCGEPEKTFAQRTLGASSGAFVIGMAVAMSMLGILAALAGRVVVTDQWLRYAVAIIPLVMGLHLLGWLPLPLPNLSVNGSKLRVTSAFGVGFLLSLVIAPCGTPVLAAVLSYAALRGNEYFGAILLFAYGIGAGIPLLFAASLSGRFARRLDLSGYRKWVDSTTGALLLALGFYLLWIA